MSDKDFIIHVLNNFPNKYDVILDGLENCLALSDDDALTIEVLREKSNHRYKRLRLQMKKITKKKRPC